MIAAIFEFVADVFEHLYVWLSAIRFGNISMWSILLGCLAAGVIFKGLHSIFFKEEE